MATIIVEDGTIVTNANSYVSVADANAFFALTHDAVWIAGDSASPTSIVQREAALIKAFQYMQQAYRMLWKGSRVNPYQAADWPRTGVAVPDYFDPYYTNPFVPPGFENVAFIPTNVIPVEVKQSQMWLARASMDAQGNSTAILQPAVGRATKREKLGDTLEVEYFDSPAGERMATIYWDSLNILKPFMRSAANNNGNLLRS